MSMDKTIDEVLSNDLWSASKFKTHFILLIKRLTQLKINYTLGRTCMHIDGKKYKLYPHYGGRSKDWVTLTDSKSNEIVSFLYTEKAAIVIDKIISIIS